MTPIAVLLGMCWGWAGSIVAGEYLDMGARTSYPRPKPVAHGADTWRTDGVR